MKLHHNGVFLFRTQLSLLLLPIILFPLAFIGYFSYQISYRALQNRSAENVSQIASLVNQNLDTTLQQAIQLAKTPLYDTTIQQVVTYYTQHPELNLDTASLADIQEVENFSLNILIHNTNIDSVDIYTAGSTAFPESTIGLQSFENWTALPWFQELMHSSSVRTLFLPAHVVSSVQGKRLIFSVVQAIVNTQTFQTVGAIVINIDTENAIEQIITETENQSDTTFLIYGANGQTIYATPFNGTASNAQPGELAFSHAVQLALRQHAEQLTWNNTDYFLSSNTSSLSGWTVAALVLSSSLMQDIEAIKQTTLVMICLTILLVFGATLLAITRVSQQITQLRALMREVELGNLDVRFHAQGRGELTSLGKSFNHMVTRLKQLIRDNYESQLQRKKAELAALHSQINPHFLYNTLGTFQMLAVTEGQERLASMAYHLGQLMRYALEAGTLVALQQEVEHIEHFLSLIKERYEERLHYVIQIPEELLSYQIPRFTLQPLIENGIYHGIDPKSEGGSIEVTGWQEERQLVLSIRDDGIGMSDEELQRWQSALKYEANFLTRSRHIGILNVQGQIQRIFGPEYGLALAAGTAGRGIVVTIRLPLCSPEEPELEGVS
ncbi:MAG TPA: sensor histidine kinase [Ktedonobacteraceae bacterium]|jgi:two-component system sensor histidine kinase YesM|nr:sensor histidine kinase [Ktedonobacteraceae bacterium]